MKKSILYFILSLVIVPGLLLASNQSVATDQSPLSPAGNPDTSLNWSGYTITGSNITSVKGSWVIPTISSSSTSLTSDATWIGIGGVNGKDLIQTGTQAITGPSGQIVYQAWIELLPSALRPVSLTVHPGDSISAAISNQSGNQWLISLTNNTTGQNFQTAVQYSSSESSAEWIEEMPLLSTARSFIPLDNFGVINFTDCSVVENGQTLNLSQANANPITMKNGNGEILASVSSLGSDGSGFNVTRSNVAIAPLVIRQLTINRARTLRVGVGVQGYHQSPRNVRSLRSMIGRWQSFFRMGRFR